MDFALVWFTLVTLLWTGFFVLEGFDFGVGMLHGLVGRTDTERRLAVSSIGPLWDGNEVWLVVAGASMFAAFPGWYATMFSGFYPALILVLAALIVRGVAVEYRGHRDTPRWRRNWSILLTAGSLVAPLLIGVALGDLLHGVPIDSNQEFTGGFVDILTPYGLYVGVTVAVLAALHGSTFLALKVADPVRGRDDQPHLVPVPERADGVDRGAPARLVPGDDRVQHADAEVEAFEDEEAGPQHRDDDEPERGERHENNLWMVRKVGTVEAAGGTGVGASRSPLEPAGLHGFGPAPAAFARTWPSPRRRRLRAPRTAGRTR